MNKTIASNSESLLLSLCKEIEYIKSRTKNINQSLKCCQNKSLTTRLDLELSKLNDKMKSIKNIAQKLFLHNKNNLSRELLLEISQRGLTIQHL